LANPRHQALCRGGDPQGTTKTVVGRRLLRGRGPSPCPCRLPDWGQVAGCERIRAGGGPGGSLAAPEQACRAIIPPPRGGLEPLGPGSDAAHRVRPHQPGPAGGVARKRPDKAGKIKKRRREQIHTPSPSVAALMRGCLVGAGHAPVTDNYPWPDENKRAPPNPATPVGVGVKTGAKETTTRGPRGQRLRPPGGPAPFTGARCTGATSQGHLS